MIKKRRIVIFVSFLIFTLFSCLNLEDESDFGLSNGEYEIAIPLVNTKATISKIADKSEGNTSIKFAADGKVTLFYNGEVIRKSTAAIFPPFPGIIPLVISDTVTKVQLFDKAKYLIKKAVFDKTKITFTFENNFPDDVKIRMRIPELSKDGQTFERFFNMKYKNQLPVNLQTEEISVDGWTLQSESNSLTFQYTAELTDGTVVKLDKALMNFDVIKFSYIDGYLGYHIFAVNGSIINIGLFDKWLSGSFDFDDPKITISVDNAFGLPVRSQVNKMELTSVTGKTVNLESSFINTGINFAYPSFSEIGTIKTTDFAFNKSNSNIREIFNEKTKTIAYDISALVNPERDTSIRGFITGDSYFVVNVAVEVPLNGSVNQLVVTDTLDIDLDDFNDVTSAEFKAITSNDFPSDMNLQVYFLDENKLRLEKLFEGDGFFLNAAQVNSNGKTIPGQEVTQYINVDAQKFEKIKSAKKIALIGSFNTSESAAKKAFWLYDDYGLGLKLGAKIKYRKK